MFFPFQVDVPMQRLPLANWALILVMIVLSAMALASEEMLVSWALWRNEDFALTQLLTNTAVHLGVIHLLGNMLFLFVFGNAVNAKLGHVRFLSLYVLLALLSSLSWYITGPGTASVGASGAIMGIIGTFLVYYPRNEVSCFYFFGLPRLTGTFSISSYWIILLYILFDLWGLASSPDGTNYVAHVSGMVFGLIAGIAMVKTGWITSSREEQNLLELFGWDKRQEPRRASPRAHSLR